MSRPLLLLNIYIKTFPLEITFTFCRKLNKLLVKISNTGTHETKWPWEQKNLLAQWTPLDEQKKNRTKSLSLDNRIAFRYLSWSVVCSRSASPVTHIALYKTRFLMTIYLDNHLDDRTGLERGNSSTA